MEILEIGNLTHIRHLSNLRDIATKKDYTNWLDAPDCPKCHNKLHIADVVEGKKLIYWECRGYCEQCKVSCGYELQTDLEGNKINLEDSWQTIM